MDGAGQSGWRNTQFRIVGLSSLISRIDMNEMLKLKRNIASQLKRLCAHCSTGSQKPHYCPAEELTARVEALQGVPLIVNSEFKGVLFSRI